MASHQASIVRKHWNDAPRRRAQPNYEVELWAAGRIASAEAAMSLLASRAEQAARGKAPWPEFAESNCASCHQPLLAAGASRGIAAWQSWNTIFAGELLPRAQQPLLDLRAEMENSPVPNAGRVASLAANARDVLFEQADNTQRKVAAALTALPSPAEARTFEQACHQLAALLAIERALADAGRAPPPDRASNRRIASALQMLDTSSPSPADAAAALAYIAAELASMRRVLAAAGSQP
jgi:hypothetical protein